MQSVRSRHLSADDQVILVMGATGVGKSTFINTITSQDGSTVGHGLTSCTSDIRSVVIKDSNGRPLVFVDTPGFDDTHKSDTEILALIAQWLVTGYRQEIRLSGILYLHRINDPRMSGSAIKNLRVFAQICGMKTMSHVILVTTFWEQAVPDVGTRREAELKETFWREMLDDGCDTERFTLSDGQKSAWSIVDHLLSKDPISITNKNTFKQYWVQVSDEIVDDKKALKETMAARALADELEKLIADQKKASEQLRRLVDQPHNRLAVEVLQAEMTEIEKKILVTKIQLHILKIPFVKRLYNRFFGRSKRWRN